MRRTASGRASCLLPCVALRLALAVGSFSQPMRATAASLPAVEAKRGMVVSAQRLATDAGIAMLRQGGNAVDAAVAVGYTLAVVNPCCGNIGGGGFMLIRLRDGTERFIDFRETAPAAASQSMFLGSAGVPVPGLSLLGWLAVAVPGTVRGLDHALQRYGRLDRRTVMRPAIELAERGYALTRGDADIFALGAPWLRPDAEARRLFLNPDGSALQPGTMHRQPELAATLHAIAEDGPDAFYRGAIATALVAASRAGGGLLTADDLSSYAVNDGQPVSCAYRGYTITSAAPPSSGGTTLCEILNILEGYDLKAMGFHSASALHVMIEAMRRAYPDRNASLGDPAFVANPLPTLLSKAYAAKLRSGIALDRATPSSAISGGAVTSEKPETTHFSVVDGEGTAVAVTTTINGGFGAGIAAPGTGFLLNNEMDDFTIKLGTANLYGLVQGETNRIEPGKRPLSSMSPTIVTRDGRLLMVLGSPGGSRIITIVLQTIINVIDYGMSPQEAVDAPRIHHQWLPDVTYVEPFGVSPDTSRILEGMGHTLVEQRPWGACELIAVGSDLVPQAGAAPSGSDAALSGAVLPGILYGVNDSRRPAGSAGGL